MKKYNQLKDFTIRDNGELSILCLKNAISNFQSLSDWLRVLPYGRTSSRTDLTQLFKENKGTCSSKHGLFKSIAIENAYSEFKLLIGIYKMNRSNTPGILDALVSSGLEYIPEAHSYIRWGSKTIDLTNLNSSFENIKLDVINELEIEPSQIGQFKVDYHKQFIKNWISDNQLNIEFEEVWKLRELCISNLSL